jgi:DNA processing protein
MFHLRNRLISMLADGLIVVEAGLKSGTLSTCRVALDLGVEVMVVPGSPIDPRSHGGNALIKNGAPLVESYTDVLEAMGCKRYYGENQHLSLEEQAPLSERETSQHLDTILALLSDNPINIEIVANESNLEMSILLRIISELEVSGKIHKNSNNEIYLSARGP